MKKFTLIITLGLFASLMGVMSCSSDGGSEDDAKRVQDSIREADSLAALAAARLADSTRIADSTRVADSLAALGEDNVPSGPNKGPNNDGGNNDGGNNGRDEPANGRGGVARYLCYFLYHLAHVAGFVFYTCGCRWLAAAT